jgi:exopolyphosphatase / guanosine-5'-triphosphate,3'-diphosphate pyrophosphatase
MVLSGYAILDAICATWPVGQLRVADRGVREGILFDLMNGGARH